MPRCQMCEFFGSASTEFLPSLLGTEGPSGAPEGTFASFSLGRRFTPQTAQTLVIPMKKRPQWVSSLWRRTRDSNPRGCYTLLAFQASSLATRSILHAARIIYQICVSVSSVIPKQSGEFPDNKLNINPEKVSDQFGFPGRVLHFLQVPDDPVLFSKEYPFPYCIELPVFMQRHLCEFVYL